MNAAPLPVSVVIPCYRCGGTLARALASVAAQTRPPAEVLLVEDCSGDETLAELQRLREAYGGDRVRILALPVNGGPAVARNAGWEAATQPYIAFLDADDSWHPRKLELQYGWMQAHPQAALSGHRYVPPSQVPASAPDLPATRRVGALTQLLANRFATSSVMLRRELPHRFAADKRRSEDNLLWSSIILAGHAAYCLKPPLVYYHKPAFGAGGLSGSLWRMQLGQLDTFWRLYRQGLIKAPLVLVLVLWSWLKFCRRLLVALLRQLRRR